MLFIQVIAYDIDKKSHMPMLFIQVIAYDIDKKVTCLCYSYKL